MFSETRTKKTLLYYSLPLLFTLDLFLKNQPIANIFLSIYLYKSVVKKDRPIVNTKF